MKISRIFILILFFSGFVFSQDENKKNSNNLVFDGNMEFQKDKYAEAEFNYRKAYSYDSLNHKAPYNLGNSLYKNNLPQEARFNFSKSLDKLESKEELHKAFHNLGNTYMQEENYQGAVDNFKKALLNNPDDEETRYNYVLAKELLKNQNNNKDKKDNKDNKDNKDKEKNKDQNQDKKDKDQEKQDKKDDKSKSENKPSKQDISPQQLKNILEAMSKEEKKVQEKINKRKLKGNPKSNKKDW